MVGLFVRKCYRGNLDWAIQHHDLSCVVNCVNRSLDNRMAYPKISPKEYCLISNAPHCIMWGVVLHMFLYRYVVYAGTVIGTESFEPRNRVTSPFCNGVARMSDCPVVLTENGFMTSPFDHIGIVDHDTNVRKAQTIAVGMAQYFLSIRLPQPEPEPSPPVDPVEPTLWKAPQPSPMPPYLRITQQKTA